METLESIGAAFDASVGSDEFCNKEEDKNQNWQARVNKWGSKAEACSGTRLYGNMRDGSKPQLLRGKEPFFVAKHPGCAWCLKEINETHFPIQAHHLIPKNFLPTHPICMFLAKNYKGNPKYELTGDTFYSTDNENNGYCLPYATPLAEWKNARMKSGKEQEQALKNVARQVMAKSGGRQLHQGSHRAGLYEEPDEVPDDEVSQIHLEVAGYLDRIKKLLNIVAGRTFRHVNKCPKCGTGEDPRKFEPLAATVKHMNQVSSLVKLFIDTNRIYISKYAYECLKPESKLDRPDWLSH